MQIIIDKGEQMFYLIKDRTLVLWEKEIPDGKG